ncbi:BMP family ABC transporter substrate-binding protein [Promicromonospora sukumoe]|uniref:BMP family ABC transporter substrate-binding protein n=1 Tax=Promicromonospora sukumoe TaxID=88382 RepID=UPI000372A3C4|nr:BMP family ABC transporter substrate-binding protein [Promicromonospora sukumoe]
MRRPAAVAEAARPNRFKAGVLAPLTAAAVALTLAACGGAVPHAATPHDGASPAPLTGFAARFVGSSHQPAPEATVRPTPGTWDDVAAPAGFSIVVVARGDDASTATLTGAVEHYAETHGADLTVLPARDDDEVEQRIDEAVAAASDLVVGVGDGVVDVFSLITAQYLETDFLLVGAQLPEPTHNVTAVVWPGAEFRGTGLGNDAVRPNAVTPVIAREAVAAGAASVLHDLTGIVIELG